jgi:hypothetical protein
MSEIQKYGLTYVPVKKKELPYVRVLYVATGVGIGGDGVEVSYKLGDTPRVAAAIEGDFQISKSSMNQLACTLSEQGTTPTI